MMICPDCGCENMEGADLCECCQQSLRTVSALAPESDIERSIFHDRIACLSPARPVIVDAQTQVAEVLDLMVEQSLSCVLVQENEQVIGIFTERDALFRLNVEAVLLGGHPISEFMTPAPQTLDMDDEIAYALQRMDAGGYRHVPIVCEDRIEGIISVRDILGYIVDNTLDA